jgi:hypothetical protein
MFSNHTVPRFQAWFQRIYKVDAYSLLVGLVCFVLILLNALPGFFDALSIKARIGFAGFLPFYILILYGSFRLRGLLGRLLPSVFIFSLFGLALIGLWQTGQSQSMVLNGIVPLSDASEYYMSALGLLSGHSLSSFGARRPLFPGFLAVLLAVTNRNLMASLGILTGLTAAACYLAVTEIRRTHGAEAAALVLAILFTYFRFFSGNTVTENLGFPLGVLGVTILWRGASDSRSSLILLGLFMNTLALDVRAGPFFVLPLMLLWGAWVCRGPDSRFSWRFLVWGAVVIGAAFLLNWLVFRLLADPSDTLFSNFSYSFYGLASGGKSYMYIFTVHPELTFMQEPYQSREIYRLAFAQIVQNPGLLLQGMLYNWSVFFFNSLYGAYSYVSGENDIVNQVIQWGIYLLCIFGVLKWVTDRADKFSSLVLAGTLGVVVSVPFLPPTDASHMRLYASSMLIFALLPGMGLIYLVERLSTRVVLFSKSNTGIRADQSVIWFSLGLSAVMLIGPIIVKVAGKTPQLVPTACEAGTDSVVTRFDAGTYFSVVPDSEPITDGMPVFHLGAFRRNSHGLPAQAFIDWAMNAKPPFVVFDGLDYRTYGEALIRIPTRLLPDFGALVEICGQWDPDPNLFHTFHTSPSIFYAQKVNKLSP